MDTKNKSDNEFRDFIEGAVRFLGQLPPLIGPQIQDSHDSLAERYREACFGQNGSRQKKRTRRLQSKGRDS